MKSPVRVFLLHSYRTLADSLTVAFEERSSDVVVIGQADDPQEAVSRLIQLEVDVVLFEADLDRAPRRPKIRRLKRELPDLKVLPMSVDDPREVIQFLEAGAYGWVPHNMSLSDLIQLLAEVRRERPSCPPEVGAQILNRIGELSRGDGEDGPDPPPRRELTSRELEVLEMMHCSNKDIATTLDLSQATVKSHVHSILSKLGVTNRTLARTRARSLGLIADDAI